MILKQWDSTFTTLLPQALSVHIDKAQNLLADFAESSVQDPLCAGLGDALWLLKEHIMKNEKRFKQDMDRGFNEVKHSMQRSHRVAIPAIKEFLKPMYEECSSNSGRILTLLPHPH